MNEYNLLQGQYIRLTGVTPKDLPIIASWYQNPEFLRHFDARPAYPRAQAKIAKWLEDCHQANNAFVFAVRQMDSEEVLGIVELDGILWNTRVSWFSIAIAPDRWGKGYGTEAMNLGLNFAFCELNLHRIQLTVFSYNNRAVALYKKLGFQREGVYREFLQRDGNRYDMYLYGLLRHEWESRNLVDFEGG